MKKQLVSQFDCNDMESSKVSEISLTNLLDLNYVNKHGEAIYFKINKDGLPYFNHTDIHETGDFYPLTTKIFKILDEEEENVINLYETLSYLRKKSSLK